MNIWRRSTNALFGRLTPEERMIYEIQLLLFIAISTMVYVVTREWRNMAEEERLHAIIRGWDGVAWYVWVAAAPAMMTLIRRYPLTRGRIWTNLGRILLGSALLFLVVVHMRYLLREFPDLWQTPDRRLHLGLDEYLYSAFGMIPLDLLTYGGFFAASFSVDYYFEHRQKSEEAIRLQLRAARLQSELARSELAALRSQLHPHFLFNSFNALATLIRQQKNETAVEIIAQISTLLRMAIDRAGLQEIPLQQELDFIRCYLKIEQLRFGDKLQVSYLLAPATLGALVPNIVLQPLVENAIKHGISKRTSPGEVKITTARAGDRLWIEIVDDGSDGAPALPAGPGPKKPGIGLANARAQLDNLYGSDYHLEMVKRPEGGTKVGLSLPWREAPGQKKSL